MLTVCGCPLSIDETTALIARLEADPTLVSDEAAAAIRYAAESGLPADALDPDIRDAIRQALNEGKLPFGLRTLREVLSSGS